MKTIKHLIRICILMVMVNGVEAATHLQGSITPIVIPEFSSLEIKGGGSSLEELISSFKLNSQNPDLKICRMVDIRDSQEVVSYIVL